MILNRPTPYADYKSAFFYTYLRLSQRLSTMPATIDYASDYRLCQRLSTMPATIDYASDYSATIAATLNNAATANGNIARLSRPAHVWPLALRVKDIPRRMRGNFGRGWMRAAPAVLFCAFVCWAAVVPPGRGWVRLPGRIASASV